MSPNNERTDPRTQPPDVAVRHRPAQRSIGSVRLNWRPAEAGPSAQRKALWLNFARGHGSGVGPPAGAPPSHRPTAGVFLYSVLASLMSCHVVLCSRFWNKALVARVALWCLRCVCVL